MLRPTPNRRFNELIGLLLLVTATLLALALVSYHPADPSLDTATAMARPLNWVGPVGAYVADLLFQVLGLASFLLVVALAVSALRWFRSPAPNERWSRWLGLLFCLAATAALIAEIAPPWRWRSAASLAGTVGILVAHVLTTALNPAGGVIVTLTILVAGLFLATTFSFSGTRDWWQQAVQPRLAERLDRMGWLMAPWRRLAQAVAGWRAHRRQRRMAAALERETAAPAAVATTFIPARQRPEVTENAASRARRELAEPPSPQPPRAAPILRADADGSAVELVVAPPVERKPAPKPVRIAVGNYKIPALSLLREPEEGNRVDEGELRGMAETITAKCEEFDVHGQVTRINPGPVVTTYEFKPQPGVKYNRVTALNDDLCLALEAESIYIERIPGKSTVGIEVPNRHRETIFLREILGSAEFQGSPSPLTLALGKDINGAIAVSDLAAMPHLLIAGSTGAGKSVALNSMIVSLLYKCTPDQLRLILVDPKRLELGLYDGVPHLYTPIITEPKLAANALRNATREMERRLKLLAGRGVRNIAQYNRLFDERLPGLFDNLAAGEEDRPLPYIVIIIDELADLMIVDAHNVEESITRLAQMARAVGIHLILATQRPSVDVITGLIKANFPARISFRVATKVDSRTILDAQGAELLLGKGDMLFLPPGTSRFHRVHGALVTEKEIGTLVEAWAKQAAPEYDESFLAPPPDAEAGETDAEGGAVEAGDGNDDPLFEDAVRVVLEYGKASTSLLQRRLRIGYGRAAHLIDLMHADGIVGPADGPKPREILKRPDWVAEVDPVLR